MLSQKSITHEIYGIRIDDLSEKTLISQSSFWLDDNQQHVVFTPNPEFVLMSLKNPSFKNMLNRSDLNIPDGVGLRFAIAALTDAYLEHRHTGVDYVLHLARLCEKRDKHLLLFGGGKDYALQASKALQKQFPKLKVSHMNPGYLSGGVGDVPFTQRHTEQIQALAPDVIAVALGQGKQEQFLLQHMSKFPTVKIGVGVGGSFESIAGIKKRAPHMMRKAGLEWVWRFMIEPSRASRIFAAFPGFPTKVVWSTLKHRRFIHACRRVFPEIYRQLKGL